mgnify:CR=1 FL=1
MRIWRKPINYRAHVFGVQQIEHYKTNLPREEDSINNSVYQEEPSIFLLKPHPRGYRERKDRTGFADKTLEKMAQRESYLRQAQKQKEVVLRYIREHKIRFAEIDEVVSEDTRAIFLQWIAQANMSSEKTGRTEYGQEYQLPSQLFSDKSLKIRNIPFYFIKSLLVTVPADPEFFH